jgi:hypothetical protein
MEDKFFVSGSICFSLGLLLFGIISALSSFLLSSLRYEAQFYDTEIISIQYDFTSSIVIAVVLLAIGLFQLIFYFARKKSTRS